MGWETVSGLTVSGGAMRMLSPGMKLLFVSMIFQFERLPITITGPPRFAEAARIMDYPAVTSAVIINRSPSGIRLATGSLPLSIRDQSLAVQTIGHGASIWTGDRELE